MEEQTTTTNDTKPEGAENALPEGGTQDVAVNTTTETQTATEAGEQQESQKGGEKPLPDDDPTYEEKLASFAKGQRIDNISELTPREMSLLKSAYDNKAEYERNRQRASELEKSLTTTSDEHAEQVAQATGQDPELLKRLQRVEIKESVRDFWNTPDKDGKTPDRSLEPTMIELLQAKPHLAGDLEALYATAMVKSGSLNNVKSQGKREALESLAHKQQAAVPTGNATNSGVTPQAKKFEELSIEEMEAKLGFVKR